MSEQSEKNDMPFISIGASSLLVIFLVLSLVTFAVLSLSSAKSDYTLSQKNADRKQDYFSANAEAESILDAVDACLDSTYHEMKAADAYLEATSKALTALSSEENLSLVLDFTSNIPTVSYSVIVNEQQNLYVTLELSTSPADDNVYYHISQWQLAASKAWQGDQTLNLLK